MKKVLLFILLLRVFGAFSQDTIPVSNGSFEGDQHGAAATMPQAWLPFCAGTTPDLLPGAWGVYTMPAHGQNYVGLITRDDGSFEAIGQKLVAPLNANNCYSFSLDLAHSPTYSGYNLPIRVRIWASQDAGKKDQLLWESDLINNPEWTEHEVRFVALKTYKYIIIEAYYAPGVFIKYRGNVLIDNISAIIQCDRA